MFLGSSGGGFLSTCGLAEASAEVLGAIAGLMPGAGGGLCSAGFFAGSFTVGGFSASLAAGDLFGSVCASRGPAASKPVIKRAIGLNIHHETLKPPPCPPPVPLTLAPLVLVLVLPSSSSSSSSFSLFLNAPPSVHLQPGIRYGYGTYPAP